MDHATLYSLVGLTVLTLGLALWGRAKRRALEEEQKKQSERIALLEARPAAASDPATGALLVEIQSQLADHDDRIVIVEDDVGAAWAAWVTLAAKGYRVDTMPAILAKKRRDR